jgi:hypothetical protein
VSRSLIVLSADSAEAILEKSKPRLELMKNIILIASLGGRICGRTDNRD